MQASEALQQPLAGTYISNTAPIRTQCSAKMLSCSFLAQRTYLPQHTTARCSLSHCSYSLGFQAILQVQSVDAAAPHTHLLTNSIQMLLAVAVMV